MATAQAAASAAPYDWQKWPCKLSSEMGQRLLLEIVRVYISPVEDPGPTAVKRLQDSNGVANPSSDEVVVRFCTRALTWTAIGAMTWPDLMFASRSQHFLVGLGTKFLDASNLPSSWLSLGANRWLGAACRALGFTMRPASAWKHQRCIHIDFEPKADDKTVLGPLRLVLARASLTLDASEYATIVESGKESIAAAASEKPVKSELDLNSDDKKDGGGNNGGGKNGGGKNGGGKNGKDENGGGNNGGGKRKVASGSDTKGSSSQETYDVDIIERPGFKPADDHPVATTNDLRFPARVKQNAEHTLVSLAVQMNGEADVYVEVSPDRTGVRLLVEPHGEATPVESGSLKAWVLDEDDDDGEIIFDTLTGRHITPWYPLGCTIQPGEPDMHYPDEDDDDHFWVFTFRITGQAQWSSKKLSRRDAVETGKREALSASRRRQ